MTQHDLDMPKVKGPICRPFRSKTTHFEIIKVSASGTTLVKKKQISP